MTGTELKEVMALQTDLDKARRDLLEASKQMSELTESIRKIERFLAAQKEKEMKDDKE